MLNIKPDLVCQLNEKIGNKLNHEERKPYSRNIMVKVYQESSGTHSSLWFLHNRSDHSGWFDNLLCFFLHSPWQSKSIYRRCYTKYVILIEKVGSDDYVGVLVNAQFLRDSGVDIPELEKSKPEPKKKKYLIGGVQLR